MMWQPSGKPVDPERFAALRPIQTLYEFDGPRTFTFRDRDGELCLAHWCDEERETSRFIVVAFSNALVSRLEQGLLPIRQALEQPRAWLVDQGADGSVRAAWRVELEDIPEEALPKPGIPLQPQVKGVGV
ncbi:MAG: DUF6575 domain-containing protein [Gemmataceae bacterium]